MLSAQLCYRLVPGFFLIASLNSFSAASIHVLSASLRIFS